MSGAMLTRSMSMLNNSSRRVFLFVGYQFKPLNTIRNRG
jgi:hypothetical protein